MTDPEKVEKAKGLLMEALIYQPTRSNPGKRAAHLERSMKEALDVLRAKPQEPGLFDEDDPDFEVKP